MNRVGIRAANLMNLMLTVNIWFLVALCLFFLVLGLMVGGRSGSSRPRF